MRARRAVEKIDGNLIVEFESLTAAAESVNGSTGTLSQAIKLSRQHKGFMWRYKQEQYVENEIWQKHPYLDLDCSNIGGIRRSDTQRLFIPTKRSSEYLAIKYKGKRIYTHRLIAQTFIPNPDNKPTVDHLDSNPSNNHISNLRWATMKEQWETRRKNLPISPILD